MTWTMRLPGGRGAVESDDFTLDDLDRIERATGQPWSTLNPWRDAKTAREFIRTAYRHSGLTDAQADDATKRIALRHVKSLFEHRPDEPLAEGDDEEDGGGPPVPLDRRRRSTSTGAPPAGAGRPPPPALSG